MVGVCEMDDVARAGTSIIYIYDAELATCATSTTTATVTWTVTYPDEPCYELPLEDDPTPLVDPSRARQWRKAQKRHNFKQPKWSWNKP